MVESFEAFRKGILRLCGRLLASSLSLLGVLSSSCLIAPVAYGVPPALYIHGRIISDSTAVQGVGVEALSSDSSIVFSSEVSGENGSYSLVLYYHEYYPWPDTILVRATDIDSTLNGLFLPSDTLLTSIPDAENYYLSVSFDLKPSEE